jgi:ferric-dicitrate binding protein FerR (iron transport regulator)
MPRDRDRLLPFVGRALTDAESAELERLLADRPELRAEWERLRALSSTLQAHRADGFATPIRSRVMERLRDPQETNAENLATALQTLFVRMEMAALVAIVGLAVHNLMVMNDPYMAASWVEALLGLPGTTLESLLLFGAM